MTTIEMSLFAAETIRHLLAYTIFHGRNLSPATLTLFAELCKLCVALSVYTPGSTSDAEAPQALATASRRDPWRAVDVSSPEFLRCALPGSMHVVNIMVYLATLRCASPGTVLAVALVKLPVQELLRFCMGSRSKNMRTWYSLALLSVGALVFGASGFVYKEDMWYIAPLSGLYLGTSSALASTFTEEFIAISDGRKSLTVQLGLYSWGSLTSLLAVFLCKLLQFSSDWVVSTGLLPKAEFTEFQILDRPATTYSPPYIRELLVLAMAMCGLIKAETDTTSSGFLGTKLATFLIVLIAQLFISTKNKTISLAFTPLEIAGTGMIIVSFWCYAYYRRLKATIEPKCDDNAMEVEFLRWRDTEKDLEYMQILPTIDEEDGGSEDEDQDPFGSKEVKWCWWQPDGSKALVALCGVGVLAWETWRNSL